MKVLVTGATGFLGSHLAAALRARGHEVAPFSREAGGDVLDAERVRGAVRGCEAVFHCAGFVSRKPEDAEALYQVHTSGTKNVVGAARAAGVHRIVVASTSGTVAISDDPDHVATETDETPIGIIARFPYYRAKLFAERAALEMGAVCVNPSLLLGPGDARGSSTDDVRMVLERRVPVVPPGGASFVDARDAAEAMVLAMERGKPGERYLVTGCNITLRELFSRIARIAGIAAPMIGMPRALAGVLAKAGPRVGIDAASLEMARYFWYASSAKAEKELGWTPRDANQTLADTVRDLKERGVVWPGASKSLHA